MEKLDSSTESELLRPSSLDEDGTPGNLAFPSLELFPRNHQRPADGLAKHLGRTTKPATPLWKGGRPAACLGNDEKTIKPATPQRNRQRPAERLSKAEEKNRQAHDTPLGARASVRCLLSQGSNSER